MESAQAKVNTYTFRVQVDSVKENTLNLLIGQGIVVGVNCSVEDINCLMPGDLITVKLEIPCPPSPITNPQT